MTFFFRRITVPAKWSDGEKGQVGEEINRVNLAPGVPKGRGKEAICSLFPLLASQLIALSVAFITRNMEPAKRSSSAF